MGRDGTPDDEAPTIAPDTGRKKQTLTFTPDDAPPVLHDDAFRDPTDSLFDPTTRRISKRALQDLIAERGGEPNAPTTAELSPEFLRRLREVRRQGVDAVGTSFGRYTLFGTLGRGGMAEVRLAAELRDDGVPRLSVVKMMLPAIADHAQLRQLFEEEGNVCECLLHPGIVKLYDRGVVDGVPYLAFELIDGLSLRELQRLIDPTHLPLKVVLELALLAAEALAYAHDATNAEGDPLDLVHRDVTPHNVLVARDGRLKIVDFGIARFSGRDIETRHGQFRGKLGYMAPEQCRPGPFDRRVDIFSLGLIIAELIGGRRVLPPTLMVVSDAEPALRECVSAAPYDVPAPVMELMLRMTAANPKQRMQSAAEVATRLRGLVEVTDGDDLATFMRRDVFSRLMPLDFSTITAEPTNPSIETPPRPVSPARLQLTPDDDDEADDDEPPAYSSTVRKIRLAQQAVDSPSDAIFPTVRVPPPTPKPTETAVQTVQRPRWPWVVVALSAVATIVYVAMLATR